MEQIRKYFDKTFKLTDYEWQVFSCKLIKQDFPKKHILLEAGQIENNLSFIESGILRSYIPKEENDLTFGFSFSNSFVSGYNSFLTRKPSIYNIQALKEQRFGN